jgi:hypothetical protein
MDLAEAISDFGDNVEIIDDPVITRFNPRAQVQQSVFLNFLNPFDLSAMKNGTLRRFEIPASERASVLARLNAQGVSGSNLFRSLHAAAAVVERRVRGLLSARL